MVHGTSSHRVAAFPTIAPRRSSATPAFSLTVLAPRNLSGARPVNNAPRQLFGGAPFVPAFRQATVNDGSSVWALNHDYFATKDTAQWIANKYGTGEVVETPFEGSGGPFAASAQEFQIKLADGRMVNAGILASYYERNPEAQFPGLADKLIRSQLGLI